MGGRRGLLSGIKIWFYGSTAMGTYTVCPLQALVTSENMQAKGQPMIFLLMS